MEDNKGTKDNINEFDKLKRKVYIAIAILAVLVLISIFLSVKKSGFKPSDPDTSENVTITEATVLEEYGLSKEYAINIVKKLYNTEDPAYKFSAKLKENTPIYVVTVTNEIANVKDVYEIEPNDKTHTLVSEK